MSAAAHARLCAASLVLAATLFALAAGCGHSKQSPESEQARPMAIVANSSAKAPEFAFAARLAIHDTPDSTARAEVMELAVSRFQSLGLGMCVLIVAYRADWFTVATLPDGPTQIWIEGPDARANMMKCTGPGLTHYDRPEKFTKRGSRLLSGNVVVEAPGGDVVWLGVAPGGVRQPRFPSKAGLVRPAVAADAGADVKAVDSLARTAMPGRPARVPEEAVAWLTIDGVESQRRTGWSATTTTAWLGRTGGGWKAVLALEAEPDTAWNLRDRVKRWAQGLAGRFSEDVSIRLVREGQLSGVFVTLEESRLDEAWAFMLDAARVSSLSPSDPVVVELSPTTFGVQVRDIEDWRSFYWADTHLAVYRSGVVIWSTKESPAELLGLRSGDVILAINGTAIGSLDDIEPAVMNAIEQQRHAIDVEIQRGPGTPTTTLRYELGR